MKIKTKLKKYFTERPKSDFWMWAFITLFFFRSIAPSVIIFISMMQIGLVTPDIDPSSLNATHQRIAENMANSFVDVLYKMQDTGRSISQNNVLTGKILFHGLSYFIWIIWSAMLVLILNLLRYGISWLYKLIAKSKTQGVQLNSRGLK